MLSWAYFQESVASLAPLNMLLLLLQPNLNGALWCNTPFCITWLPLQVPNGWVHMLANFPCPTGKSAREERRELGREEGGAKFEKGAILAAIKVG